MNRSLVRFASGILSLLLATCAVASGPALVITDSGYQLMTIGADGKAVLQDIAKVVDLRVTPGPDVPGPDDPKPPVDAPTSTSKRIKEMASKIEDPAGAAILSATVKALEEAKLPPSAYESTINPIGMAFSTALVEYEKSSPGARARWQPFRDELSRLINEKRSKGELASQSHWDAFLADVESGLASASAGNLLAEEIIKIITGLLPLILEIIRLFQGGV